MPAARPPWNSLGARAEGVEGRQWISWREGFNGQVAWRSTTTAVRACSPTTHSLSSGCSLSLRCSSHSGEQQIRKPWLRYSACQTAATFKEQGFWLNAAAYSAAFWLGVLEPWDCRLLSRAANASGGQSPAGATNSSDVRKGN